MLRVEFVLDSKDDAGRHLRCLPGLASRGRVWLSLLCRFVATPSQPPLAGEAPNVFVGLTCHFSDISDMKLFFAGKFTVQQDKDPFSIPKYTGVFCVCLSIYRHRK